MPIKLQEGATIDDYRISRLEESEALAFIRKHIVPEIIDYFEANKASYGRRKNDIVDGAKVARNLKKVSHFHAGEPGNPADEADYIIYEGYDSTEDFWPPTPFQFVITKDHDEYGWIYLAAGYKNPLRRGETVTTMVRRTKHYPSSVREGRFHHQQQPVSIALLSKREKDEAFQKLKLFVLPKAVNDMNVYLFAKKGKEAPQLTADEVLQHLKKMSDNDNRVVYKAEIPGKAAIVLFTEKKNSDFVLHKFGKSMVYIGYNSGGLKGFPHEFAMDTLKPVLEEYAIPSYLDNRRPEPVSKKEEAMCLNLLKQHYANEFPEIGKYLKKTDVVRSTHPETATDKIQYEYNDGKKRALFGINRTAAGLWILMWEWGDSRARDHLHVNVLGQSHHIKEVFERPANENPVQSQGSQYLDKRDIHEAMDFIKKEMIPLVVQEYDKHRIRHDDKVTTQELTRNLKITYMRDASHGSTVFLHSIIKGRDFKFIIAKRRHRDAVDTEKSKVLKSHWKLAAAYMLPSLMDTKTTSTWFWIDYPKKPAFQAKDSGLVFEEEKVIPHPPLDKKEELYALDIVKKRFLKRDLDMFNKDFSNIKNWYQSRFGRTKPPLQQMTYEEALQKLRKYVQDDIGNREFVIYQVMGPDGYPSMHYMINKNLNGSVSVYYEELITKARYETLLTP